MDSPKLSFKLCLVQTGELRRISTAALSFKDFRFLVQQLFTGLESGLRLTYTDEEGDKITICSEIEWETALGDFKGAKVIRLNIENLNETERQTVKPDSTTTTTIITTKEEEEVNERVVSVKLIVDDCIDKEDIPEEQLLLLERRFPQILRKYFDGKPVQPENIPAWMKKSVTFVHVSSTVIAVEVNLRRFCKNLCRNALLMLSESSQVLQGREIFQEVVSMYRHPALYWALSLAELGLGNEKKAQEYIEKILEFDEDQWKGIEDMEIFADLKHRNGYGELVLMMQREVKKREDGNERKIQWEKQKERAKLRADWLSTVKQLEELQIPITLDTLKLLDRKKGDLMSFFDEFYL